MRQHGLRTRAALAAPLIAAALLLWPGTSSAAPLLLGQDCGAGAQVVGSDVAGKVTIGTGSDANSCTLTFSLPFPNAPACTAMNETSSGAPPGPVGTVTSRAGLLLDGGGSKAVTLNPGDVVSYLCIGY